MMEFGTEHRFLVSTIFFCVLDAPMYKTSPPPAAGCLGQEKHPPREKSHTWGCLHSHHPLFPRDRIAGQDFPAPRSRHDGKLGRGVGCEVPTPTPHPSLTAEPHPVILPQRKSWRGVTRQTHSGPHTHFLHNGSTAAKLPCIRRTPILGLFLWKKILSYIRKNTATEMFWLRT